MRRKAVLLLSGGLDSAVTLFFAKSEGYDCHCLTFDYGQRHRLEIGRARRIARSACSKLEVVRLVLPWKGSSLLDKAADIPMDRSIDEIKKAVIPSTYVPARNSIFLSIATSYAEAISASAIFIGAHLEDSSGYPDCREGYLQAFEEVIKIGTRLGLQKRLSLEFPLIDKTKSQIIRLGYSLKVPFELTSSCYKPSPRPCMRCDSCTLRAKGFREAGLNDPLIG